MEKSHRVVGISSSSQIFDEVLNNLKSIKVRISRKANNQSGKIVTSYNKKDEYDLLEPQPCFQINELKCLYIEDDEDNQRLFSRLFKDLKSLKLTKSFEEAIPLLNSERFDFIVIDLLLPKINGIEAMEIIRNNSRNAMVPIIAVSAHVKRFVLLGHVVEANKENFIKAGFDNFVAKPFYRNKIIVALNQPFQKKEREKEIEEELLCSYAQIFKIILKRIKDLRRGLEVSVCPKIITMPEYSEEDELIVTPKMWLY